MDACTHGDLKGNPVVVICNNSKAKVLKRARSAGVATFHLSSQTHACASALDQEIRRVLIEHQVDLVIMLGYMKKLGPDTLSYYQGRIVNIHPSLLPKYGGPGMYGMRVHEAVIANADSETGVSIHLVDSDYDTGPIIAQTRIAVESGDSATSLAKRVLDLEHKFLVQTITLIEEGKIALTAHVA